MQPIDIEGIDGEAYGASMQGYQVMKTEQGHIIIVFGDAEGGEGVIIGCHVELAYNLACTLFEATEGEVKSAD